MKHRIAVIAGDGIGNEVVPEGIGVLEAAAAKFGLSFQWDELPWSYEYYLKHGRMMPEIWSGAMMLEHLGPKDRAAAVVRAIETVLTEGPRTRDNASTEEVGKAIADAA